MWVFCQNASGAVNDACLASKTPQTQYEVRPQTHSTSPHGMSLTFLLLIFFVLFFSVFFFSLRFSVFLGVTRWPSLRHLSCLSTASMTRGRWVTTPFSNAFHEECVECPLVVQSFAIKGVETSNPASFLIVSSFLSPTLLPSPLFFSIFVFVLFFIPFFYIVVIIITHCSHLPPTCPSPPSLPSPPL